MQFYALQKETFIFVKDAEKHKDYRCPECLGVIRMREGPHRQAHFYHVETVLSCKLNKKSLRHLQTQLVIQSLLGQKDAYLEHPFKSIGRIADVCWEKEKIVFEVQCSPMSALEAKSRCEDYQGCGYKVVWILHDKRFNQKKLSSVEAFLRSASGYCYFTNIDEKGQGTIYDQFDVCMQHRRLFRGAPLKIDITKPARSQQIREDFLSAGVLKRYAGKSLVFKGDLLDRLLSPTTSPQSLRELTRIEEKFLCRKKASRSLFSAVKGFYNSIFYLLLENISK